MVRVPWPLWVGLVALAIGLGTRFWAVAAVGAILLGYWLLRRYPPTSRPGSG